MFMILRREGIQNTEQVHDRTDPELDPGRLT